MGKFLIAIFVLFLVWDIVWWILGVKPLFPWQLRKRLHTDTVPPVLLDVRTPLEYNWFHLPGAENRPDVLLDATTMPTVAPNQEVVVICMTGHRSPFVSHALKKRGFPRVYNLTWGMLGWKLYEWVSRLGGRREAPKNQKL
ncbi:MAG: rhodanese-like domain-containing protein [Desulfobaccales bacterium]